MHKAEKVMTLYCERDTTKEGNHCIKCGQSWDNGVPLPGCTAMAFVPVITSTKVEVLHAESIHPDIIPTPNQTAGLEPTFTLRASDLLADYLVEEWARKAEQHGCSPARVKAARDKANDMRAWAGKRAYPA